MAHNVDPSAGGENSVAQDVREAWVAILGYSEFTDADGFFEVGGHSLRAVRLMVRLEAQFGIPLPVSLLFEYQTISELSRKVAAEMNAHAGDIWREHA